MQPNKENFSDLALDRLASIIDALPVGVIWLDASGLVIEANPAAAKQLPWICKGMHLEQEIQNRARCAPDERSLSRSAAELQNVSLNFSPLPDGTRVAVIEDITQQTVEAINQSREARLKSLGEASARLAHQIKTPLSTAVLCSDLIRTKHPEISAATKLGVALNELNTRVQRLLGYINNESHLSPAQWFNPIAAIQTAIEIIQPANPSVVFCAEGSAIEAYGEPAQFTDACIAVIENAIEAGASFVHISASENAISITDNGQGVPQEIAKEIFDPFRSSKMHGTGLGLAIAQDLLKKFNARIELASRAEPTTFLITLEGQRA